MKRENKPPWTRRAQCMDVSQIFAPAGHSAKCTS